MLHELLFSLLGFVGDIIVEADGTYRVKDGFDLLKVAERDQVNRIVPLGWYYVHINRIIERYDVTWERSRKVFQPYKTAMVQGVADLMHEYTEDISYLEQIILAEGPIPLSQLLQHLQKYLIVFPKVFAMLNEIEDRSIVGCQILDYFANFSSGVPVINQVVARIVLRLRVVFLKQCFAWMVHGELEDPGREFFVQSKQSLHATGHEHGSSSHNSSEGGIEQPHTMYSQVLRKLFNAQLATQSRAGTGAAVTGVGLRHLADDFDWTTSYFLSLERLPNSHISPRIASKIVFAGKAVKLLQSSSMEMTALDSVGNNEGGRSSSSCYGPQRSHREDGDLAASDLQASTPYGPDVQVIEAYHYLSSEYIKEDEVMAIFNSPGKPQQNPSVQHFTSGAIRSGDTNGVSRYDGDSVSDSGGAAGADRSTAKARDSFLEYVKSGGYSAQDVQRFRQHFQRVLDEPERAVELLELAVEDVNDVISNRLWALLRDRLCFVPFLHVIRNTYLLGKGELFQALLDGVLALTYEPTPDPLEMDNLLNWRVLRTSSKLVGLINDDSMAAMLRLRVNSSNVFIRNFAHHDADLLLIGAARQVAKGAVSSGRGLHAGAALGLGHGAGLLLCFPPATSPSAQFERVWASFLVRETQPHQPHHTGDPLQQQKQQQKSEAGHGHLSREGQVREAAVVDDDGLDSLDSFSGSEGYEERDASMGENESPLRGSTARHRETGRSQPAETRSVPYNSSGAERGSTLRTNATATAYTMPRYCRGAFWLQDQKHLARGFTWSAEFMCSWNDLRSNMTPRSVRSLAGAGKREGKRREEVKGELLHGVFPPGSCEVMVGYTACCVHGDRKSLHTVGGDSLGSLVAGSLLVGASFHAIVLPGSESGDGDGGGERSYAAGDVRYYARVFVKTRGEAAVSTFASTAIKQASSAGTATAAAAATRLLQRKHPHLSVSTRNSIDSFITEDYSGGLVLSEEIIDIDGNLRDLFPRAKAPRTISSASVLSLEVEYVREIRPSTSGANDAGSASSGVSVSSPSFDASQSGLPQRQRQGQGPGTVVYTLRARLRDAEIAPGSASVRQRIAALTPQKPLSSSGSGAGSGADGGGGGADGWDLQLPLDLSFHVKCAGGQAYVGLTASGLLIAMTAPTPTAHEETEGMGITTARSPRPRSPFGVRGLSTPGQTFTHGSSSWSGGGGGGGGSSSRVHSSFHFQVLGCSLVGRSTQTTYPVASAYTCARYPDTFSRLQREMERLRAWTNLKLQLSLPSLFRVIFDADAVSGYERIFAAIMKVRLVAHALERLWIARSALVTDRTFCQIRHSMHFFVSNLLYYLQVDVVDSEYCALHREVLEAVEFQAVLRAHKNFLSGVLRLSLIDNVSVQEGLERILQVCLRFVAACRLRHQAEFLVEPIFTPAKPTKQAPTRHDKPFRKARNSDVPEPHSPMAGGAGRGGIATAAAVPPIFMPPEEFGYIHKDFISHVSSLFQIMRKVESRGFIFRLDFNSYFSNLIASEQSNT